MNVRKVYGEKITLNIYLLRYLLLCKCIYIYIYISKLQCVIFRYYNADRRRNYQNEEHVQDSEMESDPSVTWRPRRALPLEYFIQIMVVADAKMIKYHGDSLTSYILVLMSTVGVHCLVTSVTMFFVFFYITYF